MFFAVLALLLIGVISPGFASDQPIPTCLGFELRPNNAFPLREQLLNRSFVLYRSGQPIAAKRILDSLIVLAKADPKTTLSDLTRYRLARARTLETLFKLPEALAELSEIIAATDPIIQADHLAIAYLIRELVFEQSEQTALSKESLKATEKLVHQYELTELYPQYYLRTSSCFRVSDNLEVADLYLDSLFLSIKGQSPSWPSANAYWIKASRLPEKDSLLRFQYFDTSLKHSLAIRDSIGYANGQINLAKHFNLTGRYNQALERLDIGITISEASLKRDFIDRRSIAFAYKIRASVLENMGQLSASKTALIRSQEFIIESVEKHRDEELFRIESEFRDQQVKSELAQRESLLAADQQRIKQLTIAALVLVGLLMIVVIYALRLRATRKQVQAEIAHQRVLRAEVQHRVKNNLQILITLLEVKASRIDAPAVASQFEQMAERVHGLASIHRLLDELDGSSTADTASYISALVEKFQQLHLGAYSNIKVEIEPLEIPVKRLMPIGLIINELLTNSIKHSEDAHNGLSAHLKLHTNQEQATLSYSDSGTGIAMINGMTEDKPIRKGVGLYLIESMVRQLRGELFQSEAKNTFSCSFPILDIHQSKSTVSTPLSSSFKTRLE